MHPVQVLPGKAVACLQPVEPRGVPLGASCYHSVQLLLCRQAVRCFGDSASSPLSRFRPFLFRHFPLKVRKRPWEWPYSARVRVYCHELRPLVSFLIPRDTPCWNIWIEVQIVYSIQQH
jgi:hypothetical protein